MMHDANFDTWSLDLLIKSLTLVIPTWWPTTKVSQVVRKVDSLRECDMEARVLELFIMSMGLRGRDSAPPSQKQA